jgi:phenylacetate-coenzyme A ligase PaaK-like adenylate-forming protein
MFCKEAWYVYQLRRRFYGWSKERLASHQAQRLGEVLRYAREHSPYYRRLLAGGKKRYLPISL